MVSPGMRLLRGLSGRVLPCGCLVGVYETYSGAVVATVDARGPACPREDHALHGLVDVPRETAAAPVREAAHHGV